MRLGRALATGVAEDVVREEIREREDLVELPGTVEESEASAPEEVPAAR
ncbi:hypothetical protein [Streptomyces aureus]